MTKAIGIAVTMYGNENADEPRFFPLGVSLAGFDFGSGDITSSCTSLSASDASATNDIIRYSELHSSVLN